MTRSQTRKQTILPVLANASTFFLPQILVELLICRVLSAVHSFTSACFKTLGVSIGHLRVRVVSAGWQVASKVWENSILLLLLLQLHLKGKIHRSFQILMSARNKGIGSRE